VKNKVMWKMFTVSMPIMVACVVLVLCASAVADGPPAGSCSNRTLSGDYGMQIEGTFLAPNWARRTASLVHFDGRGNMTGKSYVVLNGTPQTQDWRQDDPGTYTVNPDCTVSATFLGVIPAHFVVVNNGKDFRGVVDGDAITFVGSRVN
jgi:hypothetical protein